MSINKWKIEQDKLKLRVRVRLQGSEALNPKYVIGLDISLYKGTDDGVCTGVLMSYPDLCLIDQETHVISITEPYVAGYLAFREVAHYVSVYNDLQARHPDKCNDLIITDGNGILHPNGFGLACHLGVLLDIPVIGCGKGLHQYLKLRHSQKQVREIMDKEQLNELEIKEKDDTICGYALRGSNLNPIYVSPGHNVSLDDCLRISRALLKVREPEPTRIADRLSREYLRTHPKS